MNSELMPYVRGEVRTPGRDRRLVRQMRQTYEEVQGAVIRERGGFAIAGDIMEGVAGLDQQRKRIAGDDPGLNMMLLDVELEAIRGARTVMRRYYGEFGV